MMLERARSRVHHGALLTVVQHVLKQIDLNCCRHAISGVLEPTISSKECGQNDHAGAVGVSSKGLKPLALEVQEACDFANDLHDLICMVPHWQSSKHQYHLLHATGTVDGSYTTAGA
jgi:hypothetical protein